MSASAGYLKKGSGVVYIKNRPYTANSARRVILHHQTNFSINYDSSLDCATFFNSIIATEHDCF